MIGSYADKSRFTRDIPLRRPDQFMAVRWQQYDNAHYFGAISAACTKLAYFIRMTAT
jgi:hypothetical protein